MGYRGRDLDLRTPQTWRDAPVEPASTGKDTEEAPRGQSYPPDRDIPIWVDDTVLACCNHAYDVALAHRSAEVRVEHLLHALTRIEDAAEILEASGVRAASLRRETATVIAGEIPATLTNGSAPPRRADSFEEVLRLAAAHAYQRNQAVGVEDLLHVMLELRPAIRGLELIERHHLSQWRVREQTVPVYHRAPAYVPPATSPSLPPLDGRYELRERAVRPAARYYPASSMGYAAPPSLPAMSNEAQVTADHEQGARLDALEEMMRSILSQIAGQRDEASRNSGVVFDRLVNLEGMMSSRPHDVGSGALDAVLRRLGDLEASISGWMQAAPAGVNLAPVLERLAELERRITETQPVAGIIDMSGVESRLAALDQRIGLAQPVLTDVDLRPVEARLAEIDTRIAERLSEAQADVRQRLVDLDRTSNLGEISGRLELIEEALLGREGGNSGDIDSRVRDLSEAVSLQQATLEGARAALAADVRDVNGSILDQSTQLVRTGESLGELVRAVESLRNEERNTVAQVASLVAHYRGEVQQLIGGFNETHEVHNAELKEVHDALMKLNANQHTLAGSIDQWRTEGAGDMALVASRIEALEQQVGQPNELLKSVAVNLDNMSRFTVERYHRRNRFWYWLFGTDDWVAASWPSQSKRIEAERMALRQASSQ